MRAGAPGYTGPGYVTPGHSDQFGGTEPYEPPPQYPVETAEEAPNLGLAR
jgi:hypothetical protein